MVSAQLRAPRWSAKRIIAEACSAWNMRHPDNPCDPEESDWGFVVNVIHSWARHGWSDYEKLVRPETREALKAGLYTQTLRSYPWLRSDPRTSEERSVMRPLESLSWMLSELAAHRSDAMMEAERLRRQRPLNSHRITELEKTAQWADAEMAKLYKVLAVDEEGNRRIAWGHDEGDYWWLGLDLAQNYIEPMYGARCRTCDSRVWRTKRPIDLGAGVRTYIFSCHCTTALSVSKHGQLKWSEEKNETASADRAPGRDGAG